MKGPITPGGVFLSTMNYVTTPSAPGVTLYDETGGVATARSTAGLVTLSSSIRQKLMTAPTVAGLYTPVWDDATVVIQADEEVLVSPTAVAVVAATSTVVTTNPSVFNMKQHDTREALSAQIIDDDDVVVDLTLASTKRFLMKHPTSGLLKVDDTTHVTITDAAQGLVSYQWQTADTDTAADWNAEFEFTFADGRILTAPTLNYLTIHIVADLGP